MQIILQSYPPLGQVTTIHHGETSLTAVLEVPQHKKDEAWQVCLWCSDSSNAWNELKLEPLDSSTSPAALQAPRDSTIKLYFSSPVSFSQFFQFTLKFRHGEGEDWTWIRDVQGVDDGYIVTQTPSSYSEQLTDCIPDLNQDWTVKSHMSQSPRSQLWSLQTTVPGASGDSPNHKDIEVGTPWGSFLRWFALVRHSAPWLAPRQGKSRLTLDKDAVLCSFLSPQGRHLVFLGISGFNDVLTVLRSTSSGAISARNDSSSDESITVLVSESVDFNHAVAAVMYHARTFAAVAASASQDMPSAPAITEGDNGVKPQWREDWYDGLGFCTWNSLGQDMTEKKLVRTVRKLAEANIRISNVVIDDGWQHIDRRGRNQFQRGWVDFEADPMSFPSGLKSTVSQLKEENPWIQHVAVWHALLGYWGGIASEGKLAEKYKTLQVLRADPERGILPDDNAMTVVSSDDVSRFYNDCYKFLSDCGIDAVKTDAQYMVDTWTSASARREHLKPYLDAWALSSLRHFGFKAISCMSQHPQVIFYSQMHQGRPPFLVRNSDDFFPDVPDSHPWHIWANAHNAILADYLNVVPDWDMFQTDHEYSGFHAAARCVSGGPIYITDAPGHHDLDILEQITGTTIRGKTVIFRPSVFGRSIWPYVGYHDDMLLKVGSYNGASDTGTPILGVFNVSSRPLTEILSLSYFPGIGQSRRYVVRAHTTGHVSAPMLGGNEQSLITSSLGARGYEVFSAFPLTFFTGLKHRDIEVSNLGLLGKMTGCAAIVSSGMKMMENGRIMLDTRLKALGILGVYISSLPSMTVEGDFMITIQGQPIPVETVGKSKRDEHVLEVDVEQAWKDMELHGGWSNEVEVKVYFSS